MILVLPPSQIARQGLLGSTYLCFFPNSLVDHVVVLDDLFLDRIAQILHTGFLLLEVDVAQATVEENLARVELEEQAKLGVVDHGVASQVEQRIVEVGQGLFEITQQKVRYTLLEICDREILIQADGALVGFDLYATYQYSSSQTAVSRRPGLALLAEKLTAFSCSPRVAWMTPMLKRILLVSAILSNSPTASSNSLLS